MPFPDTFRPWRTLVSIAVCATVFSACNTNDSNDDSGKRTFTGTPDTVHVDASWAAHATYYRGQDSLTVAYDCPANGNHHSLWGVDVYTDDSSVCTAGVHAGKITFASGGRVVIEIRPGEESYESSTRNGVTSSSWPSWPGSFIVL